jgi:DNA end-binding protein Ku
MARAIWSGAVSFGLVNVPVRMYAAIASHDLHFHLVHAKDQSRIGYDKVCKKEGKEVPDDEIVKVFETDDGDMVEMTDEDFEAAQTDGFHAITVEDFVPLAEIDPIYFSHTYHLGPAPGAERVYALLARAMADSGLAAIGRFVMRQRQNLGCLRVVDGVLTLSQMHFADEIRDAGELKPSGVRVGRQELAMARDLIDRFTGSFRPEQYRDTYRDALRKVIEEKQKGGEVKRVQQAEPAPPDDLMAALEESLAAARGRRRSTSSSSRRRSRRAPARR